MQRPAVIITQYFHDLYRFYKLHPLKSEFDDVFNLPVNIHEAGFFKLWIDDISILRNIGEFYFEKNHFTGCPHDLYADCEQKPEL